MATNDLLVQVDDLPADLIAALEADGKGAAAPAAVPPMPLVKTVAPAKTEPKAAPQTTPAPDNYALDAARRESQTMREQIALMAQRLEQEAEARAKSDQFGSYRTAQALQQAVGRHQAHVEGIDAQLSAFKASLQQSRMALAQAKTAGDVNSEIAHTEAMQNATTQIAQLEAAKVSFAQQLAEAEAGYRDAVADYNKVAAEVTKKAEKRPDAQPQPERPRTPEQWIDQFPKKMAGWLHAHKDYVTDGGKHNELMTFMNAWIDDYGPMGLQTPQFVEALNQKFDPPPPSAPEVVVDPPAPVEVEMEPPRQSATAVAAPVSRSSAPAKASGPPASVRLTAEQAAIAPQLYPELSPADAQRQYAKDLLQAHADKRFDARS